MSKESQLAVQLDELTEIIAHWEDSRDEVYHELCKLAGKCPVCLSDHYPHCKTQQSVRNEI